MEENTIMQNIMESVPSENLVPFIQNEAQSIMDDATQEMSEDQMKKFENLSTAREGSRLNGTPFDDFSRFKKKRTLVRANKKIGRNDPCPCGSGKKYKNCCLASGKYETLEEVD